MPGVKTDKGLRILMLACLPFFSARGTPISIRSRLEDLSLLGHQVDLVTYPVGQDIELPGLRTLRTVKVPFITEVPVGPSFKKLVLDVLIFFKALRLLITNKYDLIHTHEEASYFGALFSKTFRVLHLYDFHSSLPQAMKNFGYEKQKSLISVMEYFERHVIRSCAGVITISKDLDSYVGDINNEIPRIVLENFKNHNFKPDDNLLNDSFKAFESALNGNKVILYSGTFEHYQGLGLLLDAAELLTKTKRDATFVLAGGRKNQIEDLKASALKRGISDYVHFTGNLQFDELLHYMNRADILISTRIIGNNPPLKIYDYLGAGKPIIATNIIAHTQILNSDTAALVDPAPQAIVNGIMRILEDPTYAKRLARSSRKFFKDKYNTADKLERIKQFLDLVMKGRI